MNPKQKPETIKSGQKTTSKPKLGFVFDKSNYQLVILGLIFIAVGFILMSGGGSDDPNVFDRSIFSFRRITLAPILVLIGYVIEVYAIMKKPVTEKQAE
jgi:hypothetical protein